MSYQDFITSKNLWRAYYNYRSKHLGISTKRAMRAFCVQHGYVSNRRQMEANLQFMILVGKESWLDKELPL